MSIIKKFLERRQEKKILKAADNGELKKALDADMNLIIKTELRERGFDLDETSISFITKDILHTVLLLEDVVGAMRKYHNKERTAFHEYADKLKECFPNGMSKDEEREWFTYSQEEKVEIKNNALKKWMTRFPNIPCPPFHI